MKKLAALLFIIPFALTSCKDEAEKQTPKVVVPFYQIDNAQGNQSAATNQPQSNQNALSQQEGVVKYVNPQTQTIAAPTTVAKGMNPAHGQPGHRCDLPVGAPLNSAAKTNPVTTTQVSTSPNVSVTPKATTTTTATPAGMNPPHGQPGHRCDIPVGSSLSAPKAPAPVVPAVPALLATPTESGTTAVDPSKQ
jgi:hypothetical protein